MKLISVLVVVAASITGFAQVNGKEGSTKLANTNKGGGVSMMS